MTIEQFLLALYGSIVIADGFLVQNMFLLAFRECRRTGARRCLSDNYFWLAMNMGAQSLFIGIICSARVINIVAYGEHTTGNAGWMLAVGFAGLLVTKLGFNWSASADRRRGHIWQGVLLAFSVAWWVWVVGWSSIA